MFIHYLNFLLARQLSFTIDANGLSLGNLAPFDWGIIEAKDLNKPPNGSRDFVLVTKTSMSLLFVDGLKHFRNEFECNKRNCPINCPDSESGPNGSFISRQRRALLCLNDTESSRILNFTCSVPCPALIQAEPRIVWLTNETLVTLKLIFKRNIRITFKNGKGKVARF